VPRWAHVISRFGPLRISTRSLKWVGCWGYIPARLLVDDKTRVPSDLWSSSVQSTQPCISSDLCALSTQSTQPRHLEQATDHRLQTADNRQKQASRCLAGDLEQATHKPRYHIADGWNNQRPTPPCWLRAPQLHTSYMPPCVRVRVCAQQTAPNHHA
jgi:hypothetical protein